MALRCRAFQRGSHPSLFRFGCRCREKLFLCNRTNQRWPLRGSSPRKLHHLLHIRMQASGNRTGLRRSLQLPSANRCAHALQYKNRWHNRSHPIAKIPAENPSQSRKSITTLPSQALKLGASILSEYFAESVGTQTQMDYCSGAQKEQPRRIAEVVWPRKREASYAFATTRSTSFRRAALPRSPRM